ncbi:MAG: DUF5711 family protein [Clostridiales bacterium]|nr:DUF5711 family protein [Clostridiales bacterium]
MSEERRQADRKQKLKASRRDNRWKVIMVLLVLLIAALASVMYLFGIDFAAVSNGFRDEDGNSVFSSSSGVQYPYYLDNSSDLQTMKAVKEQLFLLNDNTLYFINAKTGKTARSAEHQYSNPVCDTAGRYVLTYDQARYRVRIDTASELRNEQTFNQEILTACIADNGAYAVATTSDQAASEVTVYSRSFKELFTWYSTDGYIIEMALSGNTLVVATVHSEDAQLYSTVTLINHSKGTEIASFRMDGGAVGHMQFAGSHLFVISDNACSVILNQKEKKDLLLPGEQTVLCYDFTPNDTLLLAYAPYESANSAYLISFSRKGDTNYDVGLDGTVRSVSGTRSQAHVLLEDRIVTLNQKGESKSDILLGDLPVSLSAISGRLYVRTASQIQYYEAKAR